MDVQRAQLVGVVLLKGSDDSSLLLALPEHFHQALQGLEVRLLAEEALDDEVVDYSRGLFACGPEEPAYFEELGPVGGEGGLEPVDAVEQEGEVLLRGEAHPGESLESRGKLLAGVLGAEDQLVVLLDRSLGPFFVGVGHQLPSLNIIIFPSQRIFRSPSSCRAAQYSAVAALLISEDPPY